PRAGGRPVLRRLRRREREPGGARQGQARAQGHSAPGGQHRPAHLRAGRQRAAAGRRRRRARTAARTQAATGARTGGRGGRPPAAPAARAMNPDWNTPPGGDFVRYVEQLTARALATAARSGGAVLLGDDDATPPPVAARVLEPPRPAAAKKQPDAAAPKRPAHLGLKLLIGWAIVVGLFASGHAGLWTLALFAAAL